MNRRGFSNAAVVGAVAYVGSVAFGWLKQSQHPEPVVSTLIPSVLVPAYSSALDLTLLVSLAIACICGGVALTLRIGRQPLGETAYASKLAVNAAVIAISLAVAVYLAEMSLLALTTSPSQ